MTPIAVVLRRHLADPRRYWVAVGALAVTVGLLIAAQLHALDAQRRRWGTPVPVVVAARALPAGHTLRAGDLVTATRPAPLVPREALTEVPGSGTLTAGVDAGEVLTSARLAPGGLGPVAALVPAGRRAVAVPVDPGAMLRVTPGDRVDLLAAADGFDAVTVAADAPVVDAGEGTVAVAVRAAEAARVAAALASGPVVVALRGA